MMHNSHLMISLFISSLLLAPMAVSMVEAGGESGNAILEIEAEVLSVESSLNQETGLIETMNTLKVIRTLVGTPGSSPVIVNSYGGSYEDLLQFANGWPTFSEGEIVRVRLSRDVEGIYRPVFGEVNKVTLSPTEKTSELSSSNYELGYSDSGREWLTMPVNYYIEQTGTADVPGTSEFGQIQLAHNVWDRDPGSFFDLNYVSLTDKSPSAHFDFTNTVGWVPSIPNNPLALTTCRGQPMIVECDMEINDLYFWSTTGASGTYDIRNVAVHEFGHFITLNDLYGEGDSEETMYYQADPGETKKRDLFWGDAAGVRWVYGYGRLAFWVGWWTQGADAAIGYFGGLSYRRDILFVHVDNPGGENSIRYRYGYDLSTTTGEITGGYSSERTVPGWVGSETSGLGVAVKAIGHGSADDIFLAWVDNPSGADKIYYKVGWDIQSDGSPTEWSANRIVPYSLLTNTFGLGADIANIDGDSALDLVLSWVGDNGAVYYRIGWDISTEGFPSSWSSLRVVYAVENWGLGAGVRFADINYNGILDAVFAVTVNEIYPIARFKIAWDISSTGWFTSIISSFLPAGVGGAGLGVDVVSLHSASPLEILVVTAYDDYFSDRVYYSWT